MSAENPDTDPRILERLDSGWIDTSLALTALRNPNCPPHALRARFSGEPSPAVKEAAANNPNCPRDVLDQLVLDRDRKIRKTARETRSRQPRLGTQFQEDEALIRLPDVARARAARDTHDQATLELLATDPDPVVRAAAAANPLITPEMIERFCDDADAYARGGLVHNPAASHELLQRLANDHSYTVRRALASRRGLALAVQQHLARDPHWQVRDALAHNRGADPSILVWFTGPDADPDNRSEALRNPSCPSETLRAALEGQPSLATRLAIAANRDCPQDLTDRLAVDPDPRVRENARRTHRARVASLATAALGEPVSG